MMLPTVKRRSYSMGRLFINNLWKTTKLIAVSCVSVFCAEKSCLLRKFQALNTIRIDLVTPDRQGQLQDQLF